MLHADVAALQVDQIAYLHLLAAVLGSQSNQGMSTGMDALKSLTATDMLGRTDVQHTAPGSLVRCTERLVGDATAEATLVAGRLVQLMNEVTLAALMALHDSEDGLALLLILS